MPELFKIFKGNSSDLSKIKANNGCCYFTKDDGKFYIDIAGDGITDAIIGENRIPLNSQKAEKVKYSLHIGDYIYDGSEETNIPIYDGKWDKEEVEG